MNILILTQYFKPEAFIINELSLEMESLGHQVTILTGKPNYPEGRIYPGYRAWGCSTELYGKKIKVMRVPMIPRGQGGAVRLILNYLSFALSASFFSIFFLFRKKIDAVFVFAVSPITAALPGIVLKYLKKSYLIVWVLDLWPESLQATRYVQNARILRMVRVLVRFIYKNTDLILTSSKAFFGPVRRVYKAANLAYYPNSFRKVSDEAYSVELPAKLTGLLEENFCIVCAGNIGKAQGVETIMEAAKVLQERPDTSLDNLKIVFVGSGSSMGWAEEQKRLFNLRHIEFVGRVDSSLMPGIYKRAKATLLTLHGDEILSYTLPWRTQAYMAAGKPIVASIDGEAARIIAEADCGYVGPADNSVVLAENILKTINSDSVRLHEMGHNSLRYFEENFEMRNQMVKLLDLIRASSGRD